MAQPRPRKSGRRFGDFAIDQAEHGRSDEAGEQEDEHDRLEDEDDVPGVPVGIPGREGPHAVVVGEVEQDVAERGEEREAPEENPARRDGGLFSADMMEAPAEERDHEGDHGRADERVGESAMVLEADQRPAESPEDVEVGGFRGECHGQRGVRGLAIEAGAAQACAGEEVGDWFHELAFEGKHTARRTASL